MKPRRIIYVTGTRADFGLMQSTLQAIQAAPEFELALAVTGMHLSALYGNTIEDIRQAGLPIFRTIPVNLDASTGRSMVHNLATMTAGLADCFADYRPDLALLLGDRGEMLAGAIAALHLNIPVAHIHGGERSGTVDESIRHAISKLAHIHLVTSEDAAARLRQMGERADRVFVCGAPGLDGLVAMASKDRATLCTEAGLDPNQQVALMVYHPVLQEQASAYDDTTTILQAILDKGFQAIVVEPNSDAGADDVRAALAQFRDDTRLRILPHLARPDFISWMASCDVMVGNSSSGIIEAASFGAPVINIGSRQNLRLRNPNVMDVACERTSLENALDNAKRHLGHDPINLYGDGNAGLRIVDALSSVPLDAALLSKVNSY